MNFINSNGQPTCVFCDSQDTGLTVSGLDICKYHLALITEQPAKPPVSDIKPRNFYFGNMHIATMDDIGRVIIPERFYSQISMQKGSRLTALLHDTNKFAELFANESGNTHIDDFNRVLLPPCIVDELGWSECDKIAVALDTDHKLMRLTLQNKYVPKCVFCSSSNIAMKLQGRDICEHHLQKIKNFSNYFSNTN